MRAHSVMVYSIWSEFNQNQRKVHTQLKQNAKTNKKNSVRATCERTVTTAASTEAATSESKHANKIFILNI